MSDKKLSYWDLGTALRHTAEALQSLPANIIARADDDACLAYAKLVERIENHHRRIKELTDQCDELEEKYLDKMDAANAKIKERRDQINATLKSVAEISVPYNVERFFDLYERFNRLDDQGFERLIKFAEALK